MERVKGEVFITKRSYYTHPLQQPQEVLSHADTHVRILNLWRDTK